MRDWLRMALVLLGFVPVISFLTFELMTVQSEVQRIADAVSLAIWLVCAVVHDPQRVAVPDRCEVSVTVEAPPLRDYQVLCVEHVESAFAAGEWRAYVEMPTGCGKTRVLAELARRSEGRVLAVAHLRELVASCVKGSRRRPVSTSGRSWLERSSRTPASSPRTSRL